MDPEERCELIEKVKRQIRRNNWNYLSRHPEIRAIIRMVVREVVKNRPENIYDFTAGLFHCDNMQSVTAEINAQMERLSTLTKQAAWTEYDGEMSFSRSTASAKAKTSPATSILNLIGWDAENAEECNEECTCENVEEADSVSKREIEQ